MNCITILPVVPPLSHTTLDKVIAPFFMDLLAKRLGMASVMTLNILGPRFHETLEKTKNDKIKRYLNTVQNLDISPDFVWRDDNQNFIHIIEFVNRLVNSGHIFQSLQPIDRCECGIVESLANTHNMSARRNLTTMCNGHQVCQVCGSIVKQFTESVYLFRLPDISASINYFPAFFNKEARFIIKKFQSKGFLISKNRKTAIKIPLKGLGEIFLDVDFVWQLMLPTLQLHGYNTKVMVVSRRNILGSVFAVAINKILSGQDVMVVTHPYLLSMDRKFLTSKEFIVDNLLESFGSKALRLFIASATTWRRKDAIIDIAYLDLLSKMSHRLQSKQDLYEDATTALLNVDGVEIKTLLRNARSQRGIFENKRLFGII